MDHLFPNRKLLHGGDYNPDQWLDRPDILEEDIRLMREAGVNCATLGIFAWSSLEPEEGVYRLDWLDEIIHRLYRSGIYTILATPSGAMPSWLSNRYPEARQVFGDGKRNLPGKRQNFCYTSPVVRRKVEAMDEKLSERFGGDDAVILWHISNELGGNFGDGSCHCELCQKAFREWLKKRYGTLERLNHAWWNIFWSHVYTDWEEIHSPAPHGEALAHGLKLDWQRFTTERMRDFLEWEKASIRKYSSKPVTSNFMDFFKSLDYRVLKDSVDVISWDNYPQWHVFPDEVPEAVRAAANHSLMRSLKKQPFLLMESTPSCVNWRELNPMKRPGVHRLSSLQAVAHGSDSVLYFQWRKSRGAYEKFHGAVVGHKGGSSTRVFREVAALGAELDALSGSITGSVNRPKAAIVFDWENWWALEDVKWPREDIRYVDTILEHYRAFWEAGIEVDFVGMKDDLEGYTLVTAPLNYLYTEGYTERVRRFVESGGVYVTGYFSGIVDDTDLCFLDAHPLKDVLGIEQEEIDAPGEHFRNYVNWKGKNYQVGRLREVIRLEGAKTLAEYGMDYCKGQPALTVHSYGKGTAWYLAAEMGQDFLNDFYHRLFAELGLKNALGAELPYGVMVTERTAEEPAVFVMNFSAEEKTVAGICGSWKDLENNEPVEGMLRLDAYGVRILQRTEARG